MVGRVVLLHDDWPVMEHQRLAPCRDHGCEHEVQIAAGEVSEVPVDLIRRRQFRGQQLIADVSDRGRLQDRARG
jgi:hypothetical protein